MKQVPLLFLGDSPSLYGGLSRIGRDLALLASRMDEFRVGFMGRGGVPSRRLPFMQYTFPEVDQWGELWLQYVWQDFAGDEEGIVMTIWDPSRLLWFSDPIGTPAEKWLRDAPFKKWGYFPIDSTGPQDKLSAICAAALHGYDRVLAYGMFGADVISRTLGWKQAAEWIPHGINLDVFKPQDRLGTRLGMGIEEGDVVVGCVMTNQLRKDWGLAFETLALLRKRVPKLRAWLKVDSIDRHWDLRALATDFGVGDIVIVDLGTYNDEAMSYYYSVCDVTMLPSLGEGFGYPIAESLACGVPIVHGGYGGGAELVPNPEWLVSAKGCRYDTRYNCLRPVFDAEVWAAVVETVLEQKVDKSYCRNAVEHLNWPNLYMVWQKWFREGVE